MSRMRIAAKIRKNPDYKSIDRFLDQIGFRHEIHPPTGKGHPFLRIDLPDGRQLDFHIACTPAGRCNADARLARLRRHLADSGYRFDGL